MKCLHIGKEKEEICFFLSFSLLAGWLAWVYYEGKIIAQYATRTTTFCMERAYL
jgi:hypothetical protein